jgi:glucokinase
MTDLVADIGGTNARVAFRSGGRIGTPHLRRTADFSGLTDLLKDVTAAAHIRPHRAALALAGPITGDIIKFTIWASNSYCLKTM